MEAKNKTHNKKVTFISSTESDQVLCPQTTWMYPATLAVLLIQNLRPDEYLGNPEEIWILFRKLEIVLGKEIL